jgi:hypothetical protein
MGSSKHTLQSGKQVELVDWEGLKPPQHGSAMQNSAWDPVASRFGLSFYSSTEEFMRNEWAEKHMHPTAAVLPGPRTVMLYYSEREGSWHTPEALDIDHVNKWKDHLKALGVRSQAEAQMGYNDVGNLRLLPSAVNRAREAADRIHDQYGAQSAQWRTWCNQRFSFDPSAPQASFDPETDGAKRRAATLEADWTPSMTRKNLSFDAVVQEKWFDSASKDAYRVDAMVKRPVAPFEMMKVSLYECAVTKQLCTRDAFDIDHAIAFEALLKELPKHTGGQPLKKADVLDAFNETSNLRLVSRAANASHEFELNGQGQYQEALKELPEQPGEFKDFLAPGAMRPADKQALAEAITEFVGRDQHKVAAYFELKAKGVIDFQDPRAITGPVIQLSQPQHPDHHRFEMAMRKIDILDPNREVLPTQEHRENLASALATESKRQGMSKIDMVDKGGAEGTLLCAAQQQGAVLGRAQVYVTEGALTPMAFSTAAADAMSAPIQVQAQALQKTTHQ